jgi:hypothetical protein
MEDSHLDAYWEDQIEMQAPYDGQDYLPDEGEYEDWRDHHLDDAEG